MSSLNQSSPDYHPDGGLWLNPANLCSSSSDVIPETMRRGFRGMLALVMIVVLGSGLYGATIGLWRAPVQGVYTALKFPVLMIATAFLNALLNGMAAQLLGLGVTWRQSLYLVLSSYAILSTILGSLAPVMLFFLFNLPAVGEGESMHSHSMILVSHVVLIALAGLISNVRLYQLLLKLSSPKTALQVLWVWLLGNAFLGCQLSWLLRPFMGSPGLPVEFLRSDAFSGNFYESTWRALLNLLT